MLKVAFAAARAVLPGATTLVTWGAVALAVGGAFTWWSVHQRNIGWKNAIASIAEQDKEAVNAVEAIRSTRLACRAAGRVWRQASGDCQER